MLFGEPPQSAVGGGSHRSGPFAQDPSGGVGVEPDHGPQQDGFRLVPGKRADETQGGRRRQRLESAPAVSSRAGQAINSSSVVTAIGRRARARR